MLQSADPELLVNRSAQHGMHGFPWGGEIGEISWVNWEKVGWEHERLGCGGRGWMGRLKEMTGKREHSFWNQVET